MARTVDFTGHPQKRRTVSRVAIENDSTCQAPCCVPQKRQYFAGNVLRTAPAFPIAVMAGNSHLLLLQDYKQQRRAARIAAAFAKTNKLAKRVRELQDVDAELEEYRQVLRAAIAFARRRRFPRPELAAIPE